MRDPVLNRPAPRLASSLGWAAVGVAGSGILTYAYLAVVARSVPAAEYADFGAFWSIALVVGLGAFQPLELEIARLVHLDGGGRLPRGTVRVAGAITAVTLLAVLAGWPLLRRVLGADVALLVALLVVCLGSAPQFVLRGLLLGRGAIRLHGTVLFAEAVLRLAAAGAVAAFAGPDGAGDFGWTLAAAVLLAHAPVLLRFGRRRSSSPGDDRRLRLRWGDVGHLMVGSLCAQALLNAAPVLVTAVAMADERVLAAQFVAGFTLVRLPLFVAVPLQGALIPALTGAGASRDAVRRLVGRTAAGVAAVAAAGGLLGWLAGPALVGVLFGDRYALDGGSLAVLAVGSGLYLGLLLTGQALLVDGRHRDVATVWVTGLAVAGVVFAVVPDLVLRAGLAFTLGSGAALAVSLGLLLAGRRAAAGDLVASTDGERGGRA
ncbi:MULTISPECIES: lipopolysaccharide biosynthesis protein [unclassified Geodermatophilus]